MMFAIFLSVQIGFSNFRGFLDGCQAANWDKVNFVVGGRGVENEADLNISSRCLKIKTGHDTLY